MRGRILGIDYGSSRVGFAVSDPMHIIATPLKTVKNISKTGVDRISVGSITHSAPALDLKLEI